jgi:hypothetical protein
VRFSGRMIGAKLGHWQGLQPAQNKVASGMREVRPALPLLVIVPWLNLK